MYQLTLTAIISIELLKMKKLILVLSFFLYVLTVYSQNKDIIIVQGDTVNLKKDTALRNMLMKVNLKKYIGKTVEELLQNSTIKRYKSYWWSDEPPGKLRSLNLTYARGLYLEIYPAEKEGRAVQFSKIKKFDFEAFKKMEIQDLIIDKDYFEKNVVKRFSKKNKKV